MNFDPVLPDDRDYLGREEFQARVAPFRRAWLVDDGSTDQLRLALQGASSLWGGQRCPVLPVDARGDVGELWLQLAELMGVSQVVDFTASDGASSWTGAARLNWNVVPARPLSDARFWNLHPIAAHGSSDLARPGMYLPGDSSMISLAGPGAFGLAEELQIYRDAGVSIVENCSDMVVGKAQIHGDTSMARTLVGDFDSVSIAPQMTTVGLLWITEDRDSFEDAVWFWNTRALRPMNARGISGISVLTTMEVAQRTEFREAMIQALGETSSTSPSLVVASATLDGKTLRSLGESYGVRHEDSQWSERLGALPQSTDVSFVEGVDMLNFWATPRTVGPVEILDVTLRRPQITLTFKSPKRWNSAYQMSGRVILQFASPSITGPQMPSVARLYHSDAEWREGQLRLVAHNVNDYGFQLRIPTPVEILSASCSRLEVEYELSDKGQQVEGAFQRGVDPSLFRRRSALAVIRALTPKAGRTLLKELERLKGSVSERQVDALAISQLESRRLSRTMDELRSMLRSDGLDPELAPATTDELVHRGLVVLGVEVHCPVCSLRSFQRLTEISGGAVCDGCGARAKFALDGNGSPTIHYRLNSLIQRLSINGGLAPLAASALLMAERAFVMPGVNLRREGRQFGEVDLLGWVGQSLFAGEAKSSSRGLDLSDITADVAKSAGVGADTHIAVCLERVSAEAKARLEASCREHGVQLRLLDGDALLTAD